MVDALPRDGFLTSLYDEVFTSTTDSSSARRDGGEGHVSVRHDDKLAQNSDDVIILDARTVPSMSPPPRVPSDADDGVRMVVRTRIDSDDPLHLALFDRMDSESMLARIKTAMTSDGDAKAPADDDSDVRLTYMHNLPRDGAERETTVRVANATLPRALVTYHLFCVENPFVFFFLLFVVARILLWCTVCPDTPTYTVKDGMNDVLVEHPVKITTVPYTVTKQ